MTVTRVKNLTSSEAARLLGVSEASIKRWADSGLLTTVKTAGGHRRFRPEDIALFKHASAAERRHKSVGEQAQAKPAERSVKEAKASSLSNEDDLIEEVFHALLAGQAADVSALLVKLHLHGQTVAALADRFLCPPLRRIGDLWHGGELSVAEEHVASRTAMLALRNLQAVMEKAEEKKLLALCCSVEDDFHEIPVQLAALTLEACGFEVFNLGTSTPFFALTEALERFKPGVVCVASTLLNSFDRAAREYTEFHNAARRAHTAVVLGGAGFANAEVRRRLPAEMHAGSFQQLESFVGGLSGESRALTGGA